MISMLPEYRVNVHPLSLLLTKHNQQQAEINDALTNKVNIIVKYIPRETT